MLTIHPQYITDKEGNKLSAILPLNEFKTILDELEELEDMRLYNEGKEDDEPAIPIEEAIKLIEAKRAANGL